MMYGSGRHITAVAADKSESEKSAFPVPAPKKPLSITSRQNVFCRIPHIDTVLFTAAVILSNIPSRENRSSTARRLSSALFRDSDSRVFGAASLTSIASRNPHAKSRNITKYITYHLHLS